MFLYNWLDMTVTENYNPLFYTTGYGEKKKI